MQEGKSKQTSASMCQHPVSKEILIYALLDSQCDSSFILEVVANDLDGSAEQVKRELSTMSSKRTIVPCRSLQGLQIRGMFSSVYHPHSTISLYSGICPS